SLKTTYPVLLIGSGNTHELPDIKGHAILVFHFDYTSGIPQISGSSIKGLLRSAFAYEGYIKEL
ncbi:RAMP superfamily CRISPR-associated protein, partial [Aliarcobacter butzleri]